MHWAHEHRHLFTGGELFVNMHGYTNRAQVEHITLVDNFLLALGQSTDPTLPPRGRGQLLSSILASRKTLVILDNVRDTDHVRELVPLLSNCLVLITSRQWLTSLSRETGAQRIIVPQMSRHESDELLSTQPAEETSHILARLVGAHLLEEADSVKPLPVPRRPARVRGIPPGDRAHRPRRGPGRMAGRGGEHPTSRRPDQQVWKYLLI